MAKFIKCDTCPAMSPDKDDMHVANHWKTIVVKEGCGSYKREKEYILCNECTKKGVILSDKGVSHG